MKTIKKKLSLILNTAIAGFGAIGFVPLTSCGDDNSIQLANYESYMSQDLIQDLQHNLGYPIHFPYYTTAEMIPAKFEKYYDIAVPCGYELLALLRKGWLTEIDWAKFEVTDMSEQHVKIENADDALKLFADKDDGYTGIASMNEKFTAYFDKLFDIDPNDELLKNIGGWYKGKKFNILRFGVPYFAQSFMFAYKGEKIQFNKYKQSETIENPTWADIFWTISPSNPNQPAQFKNNKIAMVDDARSFYDISRIVETAANGQEITNDPLEGDEDTKDRMHQTMSVISSLYTCRSGNNFLLNTDSQIVSKTLADRKCGINGIMSWSGDTIYAAQGAEEFEPFTSQDLHIIKPSGGSLDEIEFMVINKKNLNNQVKLGAIYKAIKQICLNGCNVSAEEIVQKDDDNFRYWTMTNWDEILYTPLLKNIYQAVTKKDTLSQYWIDKQKEEPKYDDETIKNLFIEIINGGLATDSKHLFGGSVTNLQNSNIHWSWMETKDIL